MPRTWSPLWPWARVGPGDAEQGGGQMPAALSPNPAAPSWWPGISVASSARQGVPLTLGSRQHLGPGSSVCPAAHCTNLRGEHSGGAIPGKGVGQGKARPGRASSDQEGLAAESKATPWRGSVSERCLWNPVHLAGTSHILGSCLVQNDNVGPLCRMMKNFSKVTEC